MTQQLPQDQFNTRQINAPDAPPLPSTVPVSITQDVTPDIGKTTNPGGAAIFYYKQMEKAFESGSKIMHEIDILTAKRTAKKKKEDEEREDALLDTDGISDERRVIKNARLKQEEEYRDKLGTEGRIVDDLTMDAINKFGAGLRSTEASDEFVDKVIRDINALSSEEEVSPLTPTGTIVPTPVIEEPAPKTEVPKPEEDTIPPRGYEEIDRHPGFYLDNRGNLFGKVDGMFVPVDGHGNPIGGTPTTTTPTTTTPTTTTPTTTTPTTTTPTTTQVPDPLSPELIKTMSRDETNIALKDVNEGLKRIGRTDPDTKKRLRAEMRLLLDRLKEVPE